MLRLQRETDPSWAERMAEHVPTILLDHAHCEKKAASTAINLIFKYQFDVGLLRPLSELAREELTHFERMLDALDALGIPFVPLPASPYGARLHKGIRSSGRDGMLDTLLICAFIEARSCDRMTRMLPVLAPAMAALYRELLASEARHHALYVDLALERFPREVVFARITEIAAHEHAVLQGEPEAPRLHGR